MREGWICPQCRCGVSPDEKTCPKCADDGLPNVVLDPIAQAASWPDWEKTAYIRDAIHATFSRPWMTPAAPIGRLNWWT